MQNIGDVSASLDPLHDMHLPHLLPALSPLADEAFFADAIPQCQTLAVPTNEEAKAKALRARNSAAQKRYQAKQRAKLVDLESRQAHLTQRLVELQREQAHLNKHAQLLHSRLRTQEDQLHQHLSELDVFNHGRELPVFNGDYERPKMCGVDIPMVVSPELIEQHKHTTYDGILEHYARIVANMNEHLDDFDAAAINHDVQEMCAIFMATAMHNPLNVKRMIASLGMATHTPWNAIEPPQHDLVAAMQSSIADLQLTNRDVDHIMALRTRCLRMLGASIAYRRQLVHDLAFVTHQGAAHPTAQPLRGGLQLATTTCARGRAMSVMRVHELVTKLHASLLDGHVIVMQFVEDLYNKYLLPQPVIVARCCVKSFPYFPDDLAFATAVGVVHGRLDAAGREPSSRALSAEEGGSGVATTESGGAQDTWSAHNGACMWAHKGGDAQVSIAAVQSS